MAAYMLIRQSNIATLTDDHTAVIHLAAAAHTTAGPIEPKLTPWPNSSKPAATPGSASSTLRHPPPVISLVAPRRAAEIQIRLPAWSVRARNSSPCFLCLPL
jgi:hypothetical protein